ncbi:hypothetical protein [Streptomyces sp. NPDC059957]|uniref:hypothetical protein n=1 Tax=unclassified Streptomyces TaxID=2593676 RepID=UPI00366442AC
MGADRAAVGAGFGTPHRVTAASTPDHKPATFTLLLGFAQQRTGRRPVRLSIADLDAPAIGAFLQHLETVRGNTAVTRNARLAALRSFLRYAALRAPERAEVIQCVLAIPPKRFDRPSSTA